MDDNEIRIKGLFVFFRRIKLFNCGMCGTKMPTVYNSYLFKDDEIKSVGPCPKCGCDQWTNGISIKNPGV